MPNKILVVIPCRAGSKRFPGKNMAKFRGMPLAMNACVTAIEAIGNDADIMVTSDDVDVLSMCHYNNINYYHRGELLSSDTAMSEDVVMDVLNHCRYLNVDIENEDIDQYEHVILLQVTSPLLDPGRLRTAMNQYLIKDMPSMVAVNPDYAPCGAFYIVKVDLFRNNPSWYQPGGSVFILPREQCIDIDYEYQLDIANIIASKRVFGNENSCSCSH